MTLSENIWQPRPPPPTRRQEGPTWSKQTFYSEVKFYSEGNCSKTNLDAWGGSKIGRKTKYGSSTVNLSVY